MLTPSDPGSPFVSRSVQRLAVAADARASTEVSLSQLFGDLTRGRCHVVEEFFSETRCFLVVSFAREARFEPIEGRRLEILERVLGGMRQKNIALDFDLAASTVALNARLALEALGVSGKPSRMHPLLMLAARAAARGVNVDARCASVAGPDGELRVVSLARPDQGLDRDLPSAELAVVRSLIEGCSYEEIAAARGTSTRTVANQISAVFRRLRVSGRSELVHRLFLDDPRIGDAFDGERRTLSPHDSEPPVSSTRRSA